MVALLSKTVDFKQHVFRNITSISDAPFDDLSDDKSFSDVADKMVRKAQSNFATGHSDFYYTAAIAYPFETEPFMASRFSDGSYPVWYGSVELETTIYETMHHAKRSVMAFEINNNDPIIIKKRSIFNVFCEGILFDVTANKNLYENLILEDYNFCQTVGKKISQFGYPGILSPSARCKGTNINIFLEDALSQPYLNKNLVYKINTENWDIQVEEQNS